MRRKMKVVDPASVGLPLEAVVVGNLRDREYRKDFVRVNLRIEIASVVKRLRLARGLTQNQLAARAGVPQSQIARLEGLVDERIPSLDFLGRLFRGLGQRAALRVGPAGGRKSSVCEIALV